VIPSRDRHALLADCLASLRGQEPPGGWELIVVDDGSEDPLEPTVERFAATELPVRCVRQDAAGLNAARNFGLSHVAGEIVAFLDDDTIVSPGWAMALDRGFAETGCDAIGGRVVLGFEGGLEPPRWLTEQRLLYLSRYDLGDSPRPILATPFPVGANFAVARARLEALGGFREGLDRVGGELISNGEWELLRRLVGDGGTVLYWPAAEVCHRVPAERLTKEWFRRRARAQGTSDVLTDPLGTGSYPLRAGREVIRAGRALPILARRLIEGRGSFDAELWVVACQARLSELRRQRRARD
jgi:glycosyltransferase involved in cell wall biosynthesis